MTARQQTPSQTIGPFFHDCLMQIGVDDLDPDRQAGRHVRLRGQVLDGGGEPVSDAMLEIWQADSHGRYLHPVDHWPDQPQDSFVGFGRVATDEHGRWALETVLPGAVPGAETGGRTQAPHLTVQVFARGLLDQLCTRIYFPDEPANDTDPILTSVPAERRPALVAEADESSGDSSYVFDIVLQGDAETPFFDV